MVGQIKDDRLRPVHHWTQPSITNGHLQEVARGQLFVRQYNSDQERLSCVNPISCVTTSRMISVSAKSSRPCGGSAITFNTPYSNVSSRRAIWCVAARS